MICWNFQRVLLRRHTVPAGLCKSNSINDAGLSATHNTLTQRYKVLLQYTPGVPEGDRHPGTWYEHGQQGGIQGGTDIIVSLNKGGIREESTRAKNEEGLKHQKSFSFIFPVLSLLLPQNNVWK